MQNSEVKFKVTTLEQREKQEREERRENAKDSIISCLTVICIIIFAIDFIIEYWANILVGLIVITLLLITGKNVITRR